MDCAKTLLKDLCDFTESWSGYNAKYLENCGYAQNAEIKLYKYTLFKKNENKLLLGTANPKSVTHCLPVFVTPKATTTPTTPVVASSGEMFAMLGQTVFNNLFDYFQTEDNNN